MKYFRNCFSKPLGVMNLGNFCPGNIYEIVDDFGTLTLTVFKNACSRKWEYASSAIITTDNNFMSL